jgi:hypothetical protein
MLDTDSNTTPERIRNQNESGPGRVADPGCLSRIPIFTHPESRIKKRGMKKISSHTIFCSRKFYKIENYFIFEMLKIWANFRRIIELLLKKLSISSQKIWVRDSGSKKYLFRIPDPGVKKAPDPGSGTLGSGSA